MKGKIKKTLNMNYRRIGFAILIIILLATIISWLTPKIFPTSDWPILTAAFIALLIGVAALFKDIIYHVTCGPRIDIDFRLSRGAEIYNGKNDLSYNLAIRNEGLISAKRIRAKIRERDKDKEKDYVSWLNLIRPLSDVSVRHDDGRFEKITSDGEIYMGSLASKEEDYFSFGTHNKNNNEFILKTNTKIGLNNQTITTENKRQRFYSLEIVADNMPPRRYKIQITNDNELENKVKIEYEKI